MRSRSSRNLRVARALSGMLLLIVLSGCGRGGPLGTRLHAAVVRPRPGAVVFLVDGLPPRLVAQGCREGWLPNLNRHFYAGGARVEAAHTCVPAITYAAIASLLTGTGPARHEIVGNRWFDPDARFFRNYVTVQYYRAINRDFAPLTLYELLPRSPTASIQAAHHRGVTYNLANWATSGVMWFFGDYTAVDKLTATSVSQVAAWANCRGEWPTVLLCYFPGVDSVGHEHGVDSLEFHRALRNVDHQVGRVCDWLAANGLDETVYRVLVSDHGMVNVAPDACLDLQALIGRWGRRATGHIVQDEDDSPTHRARHFEHFDTVICHQNGRAAFLYFAGPHGWDERPTPAAVEAVLTAPAARDVLWNQPGIELVTYLADADTAIVRTPAGRARLHRRPGANGFEYAYEPAPDDALGYCATPALAAFVAAGFHDERAWLRATADQRLPEVVCALVPLLHVPRAGQVVVFTAPGYSFIPERGGHGGLHRDEMRMTLMFAGPGIPRGATVPAGRSVDLVPTLLEFLNLQAEDVCLDGISLVDALRQAPPGAAP